jgi:hypothetical protein
MGRPHFVDCLLKPFPEMLAAVYVHLQPGVPAEVLPLGIKPPVIPLFVLVLDVMVAVPAWKDSQREGLPILSSK